jgi:hypothetical protein
MRLFPLLLIFALCCACAPKREQPLSTEAPPSAGEPAPPSTAPLSTAPPPKEKPLAVVRTGARPFWFELAAGGPRLIASPQHASLEPFIPWKLSRYIAGFLALDGALAAAVNQEGLMVFEHGEGGMIAVYYYRNPAWTLYSVASVFRLDGAPAALLARDTVFTELELPPPDPAFWAFDGGAMRSFTPALLAGFPPAAGWEAENLFRDGVSGSWYCRLIRRNGAADNPAELFLMAADIDGTAEQVNGAAFLEAARPRETGAAPALLARALETAGTLAGKPCTFTSVSPEWSAPRVFGTGIEDNITELLGAHAYYREGTALVLLPDGRGIVERDGYSGRFALPQLPENYVYTAAGLAPRAENTGLTLIAAWEEQKDWNVGAAGFMMLEILR